MPVRLLEERRFDPPRDVEVENGGQWWSGHQTAWRLCDDGFGWRAAVTDVDRRGAGTSSSSIRSVTTARAGMLSPKVGGPLVCWS